MANPCISCIDCAFASEFLTQTQWTHQGRKPHLKTCHMVMVVWKNQFIHCDRGGRHHSRLLCIHLDICLSTGTFFLILYEQPTHENGINSAIWNCFPVWTMHSSRWHTYSIYQKLQIYSARDKSWHWAQWNGCFWALLVYSTAQRRFQSRKVAFKTFLQCFYCVLLPVTAQLNALL